MNHRAIRSRGKPNIVLNNGLKHGVAESYAKLAEPLASAERGAPPQRREYQAEIASFS